MKTREIFQRDPQANKLTNNGQARIVNQLTAADFDALHDELSMFVCEGHYARGLTTILESYLKGLSTAAQPAAWVSGFYGSGKSHLLKMLQHLWVNTEFPNHGTRARNLVRNMPEDLKGLFRELDTQGKRHGGQLAAAGSLAEGVHEYPRRTVIEVVLRAMNLPPRYTPGRFCLWLRREGKLDDVKKVVEATGAVFDDEIEDFHVSTSIAKALLKCLPGFAPDEKGVRQALRQQFQVPVADITTPDFVRLVREILTVNGRLPCTAIILDEVQQYLGQNTDRALAIQEVAESLSKQFEGKILLVASGQSGLTADATLQKLKDRFTIGIALQDTDVDTVTRKVLLQKKPAAVDAIKKIVDQYAGEISQQLQTTKIAERAEDKGVIIEDFPLLPVRRRFWEEVLRGVDRLGLHSQLRAQLRIIFDALKTVSDKPLGHVIRADYIFDHLRGALADANQILPREINDRISRLGDEKPDGELKRRICGLVFLIHKIARQPGLDIGIRATPKMLADLMVEDLANDGQILREKVPRLLKELEDKGHVLRLGEEYSIQTREGLDWDREFRQREGALKNDEPTIGSERDRLMRAEVEKQVGNLPIKQGKTERRRLYLHYSQEAPKDYGRDIPVWIRDGWDTNRNEVLSAARAAGRESGVIFVFIPESYATQLREQIVNQLAANQALQVRGTPTTPEGNEARQGMIARRDTAEAERNRLIREIVDRAQVFLGEGREQNELSLKVKLEAAGEVAVTRLFPEFHKADHTGWPRVIERAKKGDSDPLHAVDWNESPEKHPVCKLVLAETISGKRGNEILKKFEAGQYGWPQDAIFGALIALTRTGHVRASKDGRTIPVENLDQTACKVAEFRAEAITLTKGDLLKLAQLYTGVGIHCNASQVQDKTTDFLSHMVGLADAAGGEPPLPPAPGTEHLIELGALAGNEQLAAILSKADTLKQQAEEWKELGSRAQKRLPVWEKLNALCRHGESLPEIAALQPQLKAIVESRMLLDKTDPLSGQLHLAEAALRRHLRVAIDACQSAYKIELARVQASDAWGKLKGQDRESVFFEAGLSEPQAPRIDTTDDLVAALKQSSLNQWRTLADALSTQATKALKLANKKVEPKAQVVRLPGVTLKNENEVKAWLGDTEKMLLKKVKDGPVVIE